MVSVIPGLWVERVLSMYVRHACEFMTSLNSYHRLCRGMIIMTFVQIRKLRFRGVKRLTQNYSR